MRLSPEDEHVSLYGRSVQRQSSGQILLKTFSGCYGYLDETTTTTTTHAVAAAAGGAAMPYPGLALQKLLQCFQDPQWAIESIRISHIRLVGTPHEFIQFVSYLENCNTLKTVFLSDSRTSIDDDAVNGNEFSSSGFDAIVTALSKAPALQDVSIQNLPLSSQALGDLCSVTSRIEKLQLLIAQSMLPTGRITMNMIHSMALQLQTNQSLKELRIFGAMDYEACQCLADMLQVNQVLRKLAVKIRIQPIHDENTMIQDLPLLSALSSPICSLTKLDLYLSGSWVDLDVYAQYFSTALQTNQSLQHLNIVFYGLMDFQGRNPLAMIQTNQVWMKHLADSLQHNYVVEQITINHGLVELTDAIKFYLRLNRAGRRFLLHPRDSTSRQQEEPELDLWIETLERVRNDLSCLYYFVSCNPALFCGSSPLMSTGSRRRQLLLESSAVEDSSGLPLKRKR